ncbi:MAG: hypothetical protein HFE63_02035 [Clostridiales bacterium]|nr:hypothetical protein [Clostridiales bacterium]
MNTLNNELTEYISAYMSAREHNTMKAIDAPAFGTPLVGFSLADDELYAFYKKHIGEEFYMLPEEWLELTYGRKFDRSRVSVVSWILPQTDLVRQKCRQHDDCPALEWEYVRVYGEECNRALAAAVEKYLRDKGLAAVAPMCSDKFSWEPSKQFTVASNWSERHTALICGLGTFGLCDGLITPVGKSVRIGSCIVEAELTPTERPYTRYNEYCLADEGCTACIDRCPAGAISLEGGHDKIACQKYHQDVIKPVCHERYGWDGYAVCGLCQTGVPCEHGIPKRKSKKIQ